MTQMGEMTQMNEMTQTGLKLAYASIVENWVQKPLERYLEAVLLLGQAPLLEPREGAFLTFDLAAFDLTKPLPF